MEVKIQTQLRPFVMMTLKPWVCDLGIMKNVTGSNS
jgi:hypothetical protein